MKSLKAKDYTTSLFSSLILLNTAKFYDQVPFDFKFIPSLIDEKLVNENLLNSWGMNEEFVVNKASDWIEQQDEDHPFFLQLLTSCTHHPYSSPDDYKGPFSENDDHSRYKNAIHYTDFIIGQLVDRLERMGKLNNTIIAITGDHGQAFGDIHTTNRLHRSKIYEENIKNFLLLIDFSGNHIMKVSQKVGGIGDVMPTLLGYTGDATKMKYSNLLLSDYKQRIQYMHNYVNPYKWGLLDGQWKYITEINNADVVELYDLETDPDEQINIAHLHKEKIEVYRDLCASWYFNSNKRFVSQLKGYGKQDLDAKALETPGPKILKFGVKINDQPFKELSSIHPQESLVAYTVGIPFPENTMTNFIWTSPDGKKYNTSMEYDSEWSYVWVQCPFQRPLMEGKWKLDILNSTTNKLLIENEFVVSEEAELIKIHKAYPFKSLSFGVVENNSPKELAVFNPSEKIIGILNGNAAESDIPLYLEWASPSAQTENNIGIFDAIFTFQKGWNYGWFYSPAFQPMEEGRWRLSVYDNDTRDIIITQWFNVTKTAPLEN